MRDRRIFGPEGRESRGWLHNVEQAALFILSAFAIGLVNLGPDDQWRFWGNIVGLAAAPFWLRTTHANQQWGLFALSFVYILIWGAGAARYY